MKLHEIFFFFLFLDSAIKISQRDALIRVEITCAIATNDNTLFMRILKIPRWSQLIRNPPLQRASQP